MIKYQLICDLTHEFEGWFQSGAAFDAQNQGGLVTCPVCNSANIRRALMTPNLASPKRRRASSDDTLPNTGINEAPPSLQTNQEKASAPNAVPSSSVLNAAKIGDAIAQLRQIQRKIKSECRDVGTEFAAEARKIHYGESAPENIYGQSSDKEREALADEGIDVVALPWLPTEH